MTTDRETVIRLAGESGFCDDGTPAEQQCVCGESSALGVVHRKDGPCYMVEQGAELSDYPPLPEPLVRIDQSDDEMWGELQEHAWDSDFTLKLNDPLFTADQMRAYVDADRAARGGAA